MQLIQMEQIKNQVEVLNGMGTLMDLIHLLFKVFYSRNYTISLDHHNIKYFYSIVTVWNLCR